MSGETFKAKYRDSLIAGQDCADEIMSILGRLDGAESEYRHLDNLYDKLSQRIDDLEEVAHTPIEAEGAAKLGITIAKDESMAKIERHIAEAAKPAPAESALYVIEEALSSGSYLHKATLAQIRQAAMQIPEIATAVKFLHSALVVQGEGRELTKSEKVKIFQKVAFYLANTMTENSDYFGIVFTLRAMAAVLDAAKEQGK